MFEQVGGRTRSTLWFLLSGGSVVLPTALSGKELFFKADRLKIVPAAGRTLLPEASSSLEELSAAADRVQHGGQSCGVPSTSDRPGGGAVGGGRHKTRQISHVP